MPAGSFVFGDKNKYLGDKVKKSGNAGRSPFLRRVPGPSLE